MIHAHCPILTGSSHSHSLPGRQSPSRCNQPGSIGVVHVERNPCAAMESRVWMHPSQPSPLYLHLPERTDKRQVRHYEDIIFSVQLFNCPTHTQYYQEPKWLNCCTIIRSSCAPKFIARKPQGSEHGQYFISKSNLASANMHKHTLPYLITFCNLADDFTSGRIDGWKGFLTHCIMPLIVDEELPRI